MLDFDDGIISNSTYLLIKYSNMTSTYANDGGGVGGAFLPVNGTSLQGTVASGLDNGTGLDSPPPHVFPIIRQPLHMIVIYSLAYGIVFLLGILGNSLVVSVVYRNPRMHNVTNYFIVNLAVADILVCLLCLPITLLSNLFSGKLGRD